MANPDLPEFIQSATRARLIPVLADGKKEERATSIFLACLSAVTEYRRDILGSVGVRTGSRAHITCLTEAVMGQKSGKKDRPDGVLIIKIGKRTWTALIEAKIGTSMLEDEQILRYVELAKNHGIDAIITISNQFATLPSLPPIRIPKTKARGIEIYHWSWMYLLTQAVLLLQVEQTIDEDQRFILEEMVRYFRHESSGVRPFDRMNPEWRDICVRVKSGAALTRSAPEVENTVGAWQQEERDLSLIMTRRLSSPVSLRLPKIHRNDADRRLRDDCEVLAKENQLRASYDIPDTAAPLVVVADLMRRTVSCSMELDAPKEKKTTKARVNWLLRQLEKSDPTDIYIKAKWPGRAVDTQTSFIELRKNPLALDGENAKSTPTRFEVLLVRDLAGRFSGSRTFIEELEKAVPQFYEQVGERLRAWVPVRRSSRKRTPSGRATRRNPRTTIHLTVRTRAIPSLLKPVEVHRISTSTVRTDSRRYGARPAFSDIHTNP